MTGPPDGRTVVSCGIGDSVRLWDLQSSREVWRYTGEGAHLSVAFSPSGKTIAYGGRWGDVGLLLAADGAPADDLLSGGRPVGDVAFDRSGSLRAAGCDDAQVHIWRSGRRNRERTLSGHVGYVNGVAFSPDGTLIATGSADGTLGIWDVSGGRPLATLRGHDEDVLRVAFGPDGTLIASISWDGTVRLWGAPH